MRDIISMDGADHSRLKKALAPGYARGLAETDLDSIISVVRGEVERWQAEKRVPAYYAIQQLVILSLGQNATGFAATEYLDDLIQYFHIVLTTRVARLRPKFMYSGRFKKMRKGFLSCATK